MRPGYAWGVGLNAGGAEFRSSDIHGRPIDPAAETETVRTQRIDKLQAARLADGERAAPPVAPTEVLAEWFRLHPAERMGRLGTALAERGAELGLALMVELPGRDPEVYGELVTRPVAGTVRRMDLPGRE